MFVIFAEAVRSATTAKDLQEGQALRQSIKALAPLGQLLRCSPVGATDEIAAIDKIRVSARNSFRVD